MAWLYIVLLAHEAIPPVSKRFWANLSKSQANRCILNSAKHSNAPWFAVSASTLAKEAVEGRDGFTVLVEGAQAICWELIGASVVN